eukprot:gb/GECH01012539.1/.p1 GENE.gb/GECH01012539.1/~~gb/GECH01012539.1/.p1  ORF type:complete len:732 (+),score=144.87 gb/GECH01012539.1/:1-2196(+)
MASKQSSSPSPVPSIRDWSRMIPDHHKYQDTLEQLRLHVSRVPYPLSQPVKDTPVHHSRDDTISYSPQSSLTHPPSEVHPQLSARAQEAASMQSAVRDVEDGIAAVRTAEAQVRQGTMQLREACESLVRERGALQHTASSLDHGLGHFELLEAADGELRHGTVGSERFLGMLAAVDQAIAFLTVHRDYQESHEYLQQYRHVQRRGLAALRDVVLQELQGIGSDDEDAVRGGSMSFVRFSAAADRVGRLIRELERRGSEGKVLVADCLHKYVMERGPSLIATVGVRVRDLLAAEASLTTFVRSVTPHFLVQLARDEYTLFSRFFDATIAPSGEDSMSGFVEMVRNACEEVYSGVRSLIVNEDDVDELCDAVEEIQGEAMERASEHDVLRRSLVPVLHRIAADIQERLIFRASAAISNMRTFPASEEGLSALERFPRVLLRPPAVRADAWYPPVERTLWLLGRMHRVLDRGVFEGLAPEAVHVCADVITEGGQKLTERIQEMQTNDDSQDDKERGRPDTGMGNGGVEEERYLTMPHISGHLFSVRHLVILREQTSPFNLPSSASSPASSSASPWSSSSSPSSSPYHTPRSTLSLSSVLGSLFARGTESFSSPREGRDADGASPTPRIDALIKTASQSIVDAALEDIAPDVPDTQVSTDRQENQLEGIRRRMEKICGHVKLFLGGMPVQDLLLRSMYLGVKDRLSPVLLEMEGISVSYGLRVAGLEDEENDGDS